VQRRDDPFSAVQCSYSFSSGWPPITWSLHSMEGRLKWISSWTMNRSGADSMWYTEQMFKRLGLNMNKPTLFLSILKSNGLFDITERWSFTEQKKAIFNDVHHEIAPVIIG
jgi:hypothetical protein